MDTCGAIPESDQFQAAQQANSSLSQTDLDLLSDFLLLPPTNMAATTTQQHQTRITAVNPYTDPFRSYHVQGFQQIHGNARPQTMTQVESLSPVSLPSPQSSEQWFGNPDSVSTNSSQPSPPMNQWQRYEAPCSAPMSVPGGNVSALTHQASMSVITAEDSGTASGTASVSSADLSPVSSPGDADLPSDWFDKATEGRDDQRRPQESYMMLIAQALLSSSSYQLLLVDIYRHIEKHHPYFATAKSCWRNSVRHNLSVNECFVRGKRAPNGRGFYWGIHPACISSFLKGDFTRRIARSKSQSQMRDSASPEEVPTHVPIHEEEKPKVREIKENRPRTIADYEPMSCVQVKLAVSLPAKPNKQYRKKNYVYLQAQCALLLGYGSYSQHIA